MVARKQDVRSEQPTRSTKKPILGIILCLGIVSIFFFAKPEWKDVVRIDETGEYVLEDWREDERIIELDRNANAEQYRLVARVSGYYFCHFCKNKQIWVNRSETLKIGITTNKSTRYSGDWLIKNNLRYVVDVKGDLATVRQAEINKIAQYPLWPENLKRPEADRLVVPPYHKTHRLK